MANTAMWLASIFGPLLAIVGLWKVIRKDQFTKALNAMKASPGLIYYSSIAYLWVGLTMLSQYDEWAWTGMVLVTLLGWVLVVRGIMGLFVPKLLIDLLMGKPTAIKAWGFIPLIWGLLLSWMAFSM
jgi:hypothetical protein